MRKISMSIVFFVMMSVLLGFSQSAQAQTSWSFSLGVGDSHHRDRRPICIPSHHREYRYSGHRYYYADGLYYQGYSGNYVTVNPPIGIIVSDIPYGYRQRWVHGRIYYEYNNVYYVPMLGGYRVVDPPVVIENVQQPVYVSAPSNNTVSMNNQDDITVNVPNAQGSFTPVVLKRSGSGFLGPQGEFYAEFPKVAQLKAMYVK